MRKHARSLIRVLHEQIGRDGVRHGVEVGVWKGELSAELLRAFPDLCLIMVDLWEPFDGSAMHGKDNSKEAMTEAWNAANANTKFAEERRQMFKNFSVREAAEWLDGIFDLGFLDADHFYKSVWNDLSAWWPKIKQGGVFAGHDYDGMGDRRKGWGVKRAVDEFFGRLGLRVNVEPGRVWWVRKSFPVPDDETIEAARLAASEGRGSTIDEILNGKKR